MNKRTSLKLAALTVAGLLLGSLAARAQAPSPVGDWDLVFSGSQKGLAAITFNPGNTLSGFEIVRPTPRKSSSTVEVDPRWGLREPGRTVVITSGGTTAPKVITNLLGSAPLNGVWYNDAEGKTIGILNQLSQTVKPVESYVTNIFNGEITTNVTLVVISETNAISFRAVVVPGSRITVYTYGPDGNNVLRGTPASVTPDLLSGDFYAIGKRDGLNFIEFLNLQQDPVIANKYDVDGMGPGYTFLGRVLVSNKKQIAVVTLSQDGAAVLSVYTGSFSLTSHKGKLSGIDSSERKITYNFGRLP
jgi:hypothetical protein